MEEVRPNRGVEPKQFIVGHDAVGVFLNLANPIDSMTLDQLAQIYGEGGSFRLLGRSGGNGARLLQRGDRPGQPPEQLGHLCLLPGDGPGGERVQARLPGHERIQGSGGPGGAHPLRHRVFGGLAYATDDTKMPCVSAEEGSACVPPTIETALDGSYPISRPLFMYTAGEPEGAVKEYLDWILSNEGQCILVEKGYAPVRGGLTCSDPRAG